MALPQLKADRLPPRRQDFDSVEDALIAFPAQHFLKPNQDLPLVELDSQDLPLNNAVDEVVRAIREALHKFLGGDILASYQDISDLLYRKLGRHDLSCRLKDGDTLFRMRSSKLGYLYKPEEMFHIPFELRRLVGNQRFSVSGIPSLYLGRSIYICWEELGRPDLQTTNIAAFRVKRELKLLDLRMPSEISNTTDCLRIPLVAACSVQAADPASPFKPEYIISQAILHAILNQRHSPDSARYDGIIYCSTRLGSDQKMFQSEELFENIVIPPCNTPAGTFNAFNDGFCPTICNHFKVSKVTSKVTFDLLRHVAPQNASQNDELLDAYRGSILGIMENYLTYSEQWQDILPNRVFRSNPEALLSY